MVTLIEIKAWDIVPRTKEMQVLPTTWNFWIKCFPSSLVRKLKARLCVRCDLQQQGIDVFDIYAPVLSWTTVRLLLIISVIIELYSTQVDCTAVFYQAPITNDVYIALSNGCQQLNEMKLRI